MTIKLYPDERLDDLQRSGYHIIQNPKKFCFGMDAVLLSGFAKAKPGDNVLDIGTGTGVIPILMAAKTKAGHFTMRVRIWRCEAFGIIIWKSESLL